jgi:hypothetical protein
MYHIKKEVLKILAHQLSLLTQTPPSISPPPLFKTLYICFEDKKA